MNKIEARRKLERGILRVNIISGIPAALTAEILLSYRIYSFLAFPTLYFLPDIQKSRIAGPES